MELVEARAFALVGPFSRQNFRSILLDFGRFVLITVQNSKESLKFRLQKCNAVVNMHDNSLKTYETSRKIKFV